MMDKNYDSTLRSVNNMAYIKTFSDFVSQYRWSLFVTLTVDEFFNNEYRIERLFRKWISKISINKRIIIKNFTVVTLLPHPHVHSLLLGSNNQNSKLNNLATLTDEDLDKFIEMWFDPMKKELAKGTNKDKLKIRSYKKQANKILRINSYDELHELSKYILNHIKNTDYYFMSPHSKFSDMHAIDYFDEATVQAINRNEPLHDSNDYYVVH